METKAELNSATTKPKTTKPNRCWDGYEHVPEKKPNTKRKCRLKKTKRSGDTNQALTTCISTIITEVLQIAFFLKLGG